MQDLFVVQVFERECDLDHPVSNLGLFKVVFDIVLSVTSDAVAEIARIRILHDNFKSRAALCGPTFSVLLIPDNVDMAAML